MATKKRGSKKGRKKGGARKTGSRRSARRTAKKGGGLTVRVSRLERAHKRQQKWNRGMEAGVNHLYSVTKASKPKAFARLPRA